MSSSAKTRSSAVKHDWTSAGPPSWSGTSDPIEVTAYGDTSRTFLWPGGAVTSATPLKFHEYTVPSTTTSFTGLRPFATYWKSETKFDEAEREALIGTIVDSVVERALGSGGEYHAESLEPESSGFLHVPEGAGFAPTVWSGSSTYSPSTSGTTTWYSTTREGTFTTSTGHWEY